MTTFITGCGVIFGLLAAFLARGWKGLRSPRVLLVAVAYSVCVFWAWALLMGLSACGGGDPDPEPPRGTNPPDCQAHPEACR